MYARHRLAHSQVRELMHVQFTPLLTYLPAEERAVAAVAAMAAAVADMSTSPTPPAELEVLEEASVSPKTPKPRSRAPSISLEAPVWHPTNHARFPAAHRAAVRTVLLVHQWEGSLLSQLPRELLLQELLPKLEYSAFAPTTAPDDLMLASMPSEGGELEAMSEDGDDEPMSEEDSADESDGPSASDAETPTPPAASVGASVSVVHGHSCSRLLRCL